MDRKRRQYIPPALGGSPAPTTDTTTAASAAEKATKRLISLRSSARPPDPSRPTQTSPRAQATREQDMTGVHRHASSLNLGCSQVCVSTPRDDAYSGSATTTTAFTATGLPQTYRDDSLSLPRPRAYAAPPQSSSASSPSPAAAAASAAAAAAALLKIRNQTSNKTTAGTATSGHPSSSEHISQSLSWHLATRPSPTLSLQRPPSVITLISHPAGEANERNYPATATANLPWQHVFPSSSSSPLLQSSAPRLAMDMCQEVLGLGSDEARYNDAVGTMSMIQAGLKRPRDSNVSPISDDEDDGHGNTVASSPSSPGSSSSSTDKASAPPPMSNDMCAGVPRVPARGEDMAQSGEGCDEGSATRPIAVRTGFLPRPGSRYVSTASRQQQQLLELATMPQYPFPPLNRATTAPEDEIQRSAFGRNTEEDEETDADDETGEEDGDGRCGYVMQSDPLRVSLDLAQVRKVASLARTAATVAADRDGAVQQAEEAEAILTGAQEGSASHCHAQLDDTNTCSLEAECDVREVSKARARLEKRGWDDIHRRAMQAATTPAPPSELLLDLLQHLPSAPGRAIYDRSNCPPTTVASGFNEDFHKCVQKLMTHIVLQRDGRTGNAEPPSIPVAGAAVAQQVNASPGPRGSTQRKGARQNPKVAETEQLAEVVERGIAPDVRDVVAYAQFVMQERLHQEQRRKSNYRSTLSRTAVGESGEDRCAEDGVRANVDVLTSDPHQQLAKLRAVVEKKLSLMRTAAEATDEVGEAEREALRTQRTNKKRGNEDGSNEMLLPNDVTPQEPKAVLVAAHTRFMDVVRSAAASRREKVEATQAAEQRLEAAVATWRKSYDTLLTRERHRHQAGQRQNKQSRAEALLQALQLQQVNPQKVQRHQPPADLWGMAKGMRKKERKHLNKLVKAAANAFPLPPFK